MNKYSKLLRFILIFLCS